MPMAEGAIVEAQHVFSQARELRKTEGESAVVAEVAQIPEMARDAFALKAERAQPRGARRRRTVDDRLDRLGVGAGIGDGAVAGNSPGKPIGVEERHRLETLFDALVRVAQTLLEAQHFFADDLETEMSRLDRARVNGPHRDFVHAVAGDADERIVLLSRCPRRRHLEIPLQRKAIDRPRRLPGPRALVVGVALRADQIERRALHAVRGRKDRRQVRIPRAFVRQRVLEQGQAVAVAQQDANGEAAGAIALVARPQGDQRSAALPRQATGREQLPRIDPAALRRHGAGQGGGGESERRDVHSLNRSVAPPGDTSRPETAGSTGPASTRSPSGRTRGSSPAGAAAA